MYTRRPNARSAGYPTIARALTPSLTPVIIQVCKPKDSEEKGSGRAAVEG